MAVLKEYRCQEPNCGRLFDSTVPSCIHCGSTNVKRIFLTPPGFKSDKTKMQDSSLEHLTESYGLTDYSNNPNTRHDAPKSPGMWVNTKNEIGDIQKIIGDQTISLGAAKIASPSSAVKNGSVDIREFSDKGGGADVAYAQEIGKDDRVQLETTVRKELGAA